MTQTGSAEARAFGTARLPAVRVAACLLVLAILAGGVIAARLFPGEATALVTGLSRRAHALGTAGWLLAGGAQVAVALFGVLPASMGAFAAGLTFGVVGGFLMSGSATLIGAVLAFWLARGLLRPAAARLLSRRPQMGRLDEAVARDGWRLVALMRASPIMPFAMTSYALGLTALTTRQYLLGTLAALPALLGYVVLGHLSAAGADLLAGGGNPVRLAILGVAILATGVLTWRLAAILRRVFK